MCVDLLARWSHISEDSLFRTGSPRAGMTTKVGSARSVFTNGVAAAPVKNPAQWLGQSLLMLSD